MVYFPSTLLRTMTGEILCKVDELEVDRSCEVDLIFNGDGEGRQNLGIFSPSTGDYDSAQIIQHGPGGFLRLQGEQVPLANKVGQGERWERDGMKANPAGRAPGSVVAIVIPSMPFGLLEVSGNRRCSRSVSTEIR